MRQITIALLLLCSISAYSKEYTEVIQTPNKTADQLYSTAREWFAETFNSAKDVLQMDDPVAGKLIGKGMSHVNVKSGMVPVTLDYQFTVKMFVKEGRYKYIIDDITMITDGIKTPISEFEAAKEKYKNKKKRVAYFNSILDGIDSDMKKVITSLNNKMKGTADDW